MEPGEAVFGGGVGEEVGGVGLVCCWWGVGALRRCWVVELLGGGG